MQSSLRIALTNTFAFLAAGGILYWRVLPAPWDVPTLVVFALLCPIGGAWLGISAGAREMAERSKKAQALIAVSLSVAVLVCGFVLLITLHP